jgi:hypothetical protein
MKNVRYHEKRSLRYWTKKIGADPGSLAKNLGSTPVCLCCV